MKSPFKRGTFAPAVKERLGELSYNSWDSLFLLHAPAAGRGEKKKPAVREKVGGRRFAIYPTVWVGTDLLNPAFSNLELLERFLNQTMTLALKDRNERDSREKDDDYEAPPVLKNVVAGLACSYSVKIDRDLQIHFVIEGGHARVERFYLASRDGDYEDLGPRIAPAKQKRILGVTWNTYLRSATAAELSGDYRSAAEAYRACLQLNKGVPEAYFGLANALAGRGRDAEAVKLYDRALELRPDFAEAPDALYNKGCSLVRLGRFDEAIHGFRAALEIDPRYSNAWFNLGAIYRALGQPRESVRAYRRYLATEPNAKDRQRVERVLEELKTSSGKGAPGKKDASSGRERQTEGV